MADGKLTADEATAKILLKALGTALRGLGIMRAKEGEALLVDFLGRWEKLRAGTEAMGPLPEGIFGSRQGTVEGLNPVTHKLVDGRIVRRSVDEARALMVEVQKLTDTDR